MAMRTTIFAAAAWTGALVMPTLGADDESGGGDHLCSEEKHLFNMENKEMGDFHECIKKSVNIKDFDKSLFAGLDNDNNCEDVMTPVKKCFIQQGYDQDFNCYVQLRVIMETQGSPQCAMRYFDYPYNCDKFGPISEWTPADQAAPEGKVWAGMAYHTCRIWRSKPDWQSWGSKGEGLKQNCRAALECSVHCARPFCEHEMSKAEKRKTLEDVKEEHEEDECWAAICDGDEPKSEIEDSDSMDVEAWQESVKERSEIEPRSKIEPRNAEGSSGVVRASSAAVVFSVFSAAVPIAF